MMIYDDVIKNIDLLFETLGMLERQQVILFFEDVISKAQIEEYINRLIHRRYLRVIPAVKGEISDSDCLCARSHFSMGISQNIIKMFWILVSLKSKNVKNILVTSAYPTQILFIFGNDKVYDITYIKEEKEAYLIKKIMDKNKIEGVEDETFHIGLVENHGIGVKLKLFGFDSYCMLINDVPEYMTFR